MTEGSKELTKQKVRRYVCGNAVGTHGVGGNALRNAGGNACPDEQERHEKS